MASKTEYCTCEHLKRDAVRGACRVVIAVGCDRLPDPEDQWLACTRCEVLGSRYDSSYMEHFVADKHHVAVRLKEPREMYCVPCCDYQYHSDFDRRLGLSRLSKWGEPEMPSDGPRTALASPGTALQCAPMHPGFINMGNTCFLSSVMQVLLHNVVLRRYYSTAVGMRVCLEGNKQGGCVTECCIACSVQEMYQDQRHCSSVTPSALLHAMWAQFSHMAAYEQQDAHEFLVALLDGLSTHLNRNHAIDCSVLQHFVPLHETETVQTQTGGDDGAVTTAGSTIASNEEVDVSAVSSYYSTGHFKFHGIVNEAFSGVMRSDLACRGCSHRSFKFEPFRDISLSLGCIVGARASDPAKRQSSGSGQDSGREQRSPKRRRVDSCAVAGGGTEGDGGIGDGGIDDADVSSLLLAVDEDVIDINDVPELLLADGLEVGGQEVPSALTVSLYDCFVQFSSPEELAEARYCDNCRCTCSMTKQMSFFTPPNVLIIHLKRFDAFGLNKIRTHVSMPLRDLDLRHYFCMSIDDSTMTSSNPESIEPEVTRPEEDPQGEGTVSMLFDLQGVVCHMGVSLSQGHYVCYVRSESDGGCWVRCDDEKTVVVAEGEVEACEGYILFYVNKATKRLLGVSAQ